MPLQNAKGMGPPDCEFQIGSPGGSIDDGNVQKSSKKKLNFLNHTECHFMK